MICPHLLVGDLNAPLLHSAPVPAESEVQNHAKAMKRSDYTDQDEASFLGLGGQSERPLRSFALRGVGCTGGPER